MNITMEINGIPLLSYEQVLETIEGKENHLLLGNGFNYGLGIKTGYSQIFEKMIENNHGIYKDIADLDRKSTRLNSSHVKISYAVFCLKKKRAGRAAARTARAPTGRRAPPPPA